MGNCQAVDTATLVIQHPCGKIERLYWPVTASEVMRMNPSHHVALLISTTLFSSKTTTTTVNGGGSSSVRLTRIKLLRPNDTLVVGQVYRLITAQEVRQGLRAKKWGKMRKNQMESMEKVYEQGDCFRHELRSEVEKQNEVSIKNEKQHRPRITIPTNRVGGKTKTWHPSLQSITESAS